MAWLFEEGDKNGVTLQVCFIKKRKALEFLEERKEVLLAHLEEEGEFQPKLNQAGPLYFQYKGSYYVAVEEIQLVD